MNNEQIKDVVVNNLDIVLQNLNKVTVEAEEINKEPSEYYDGWRHGMQDAKAIILNYIDNQDDFYGVIK